MYTNFMQNTLAMGLSTERDAEVECEKGAS